MKLQTDPILSPDTDGLIFALKNILRKTATAVNTIAEGRLSAFDSFAAPPTTGLWSIGDYVKNSAVTELGIIGNKYVILGWVCSASSPLAWLQCRSLTGN